MKIENELKIEKNDVIFVFNRYRLHAISASHRYKIKIEEELNTPQCSKVKPLGLRTGLIRLVLATSSEFTSL